MVFSAHGFYNYFWLPFIPLLLVLIVGTKLEVIITKIYSKSLKETAIVQGALLVKPSDDLFWFGRPQWLLLLIHFILFQNSFQLAFFAWTWHEYGIRSCFHQQTEDITLRVTMGVTTQFLCGYVTLPLYALVTQMGSNMKGTIFTEHIMKSLKHWDKLVRRNQLSRSKSNSTRNSSEPCATDTTEASSSDIDSCLNDHLPPLTLTFTNSATLESSDEATQHKIITKSLTYDGDLGEISFGASWKELGSQKGIEDITSSLDETTLEILAN